MATQRTRPTLSPDQLAIKHLWIGWAGLTVFLCLGIMIEVFHGLKLDLYLDVRQETRRLMWTLAHAHGTLFSLVHLAYAGSVIIAARCSETTGRGLQAASGPLVAGLLLMPSGFLLGGIWTYGGDPGWGILLVPIGAILMLYATIRVSAHFLSLHRPSAKRDS